MVGHHAISALEITEIRKSPGDDSAFVPPLSRIDKLAALLRRARQKFCSIVVFLLMTEVFDLGEEIDGIVPPGSFDGIQQGWRIVGALKNGSPGFVQRLRLAEIAKPLGLADTAAIHEVVHPGLMIGGRQDATEFGDHPIFQIGIHAFAHPQLANELLGTRALPDEVSA